MNHKKTNLKFDNIVSIILGFSVWHYQSSVWVMSPEPKCLSKNYSNIYNEI